MGSGGRHDCSGVAASLNPPPTAAPPEDHQLVAIAVQLRQLDGHLLTVPAPVLCRQASSGSGRGGRVHRRGGGRVDGQVVRKEAQAAHRRQARGQNASSQAAAGERAGRREGGGRGAGVPAFTGYCAPLFSVTRVPSKSKAAMREPPWASGLSLQGGGGGGPGGGGGGGGGAGRRESAWGQGCEAGAMRRRLLASSKVRARRGKARHPASAHSLAHMQRPHCTSLNTHL